jgi:hypothetical protein
MNLAETRILSSFYELGLNIYKQISKNPKSGRLSLQGQGRFFIFHWKYWYISSIGSIGCTCKKKMVANFGISKENSGVD